MVKNSLLKAYAKHGIEPAHETKQSVEIANIFEICRGYDTMAVKGLLVKVLLAQSSLCKANYFFKF